MVANNSSNGGFPTVKQREVLKIAAQNADGPSSSPRSPSSMLPERHPNLAVAAPGVGWRGPPSGTCGGPTRGSSCARRRIVLAGKGRGVNCLLLIWIHVLTGTIQTMIVVRNYMSLQVLPFLHLSIIIKRLLSQLFEEYFSTGGKELAASDLRDLQS